jgi:DNA polymerase
MHDKTEDIAALNKEIKDCKKCILSITRKNVLCGEGNLRARILLVAQAPGELEDLQGRMFIGPSGRKLAELLVTAHVKREDVYMTNLIKCRLPKNRKPKQEEILACSQYLDREITIIKPDVIVPLGYYATRHIYQKYNIQPNASTIFNNFYCLGDIKIFALRHPAALCYGNSLLQEMTENYKKLSVFMTECKWFPTCPMKKYYEDGRLDEKWVSCYCQGDWERCIRFDLEERGVPHPDWMLPDGRIDERLREST